MPVSTPSPVLGRAGDRAVTSRSTTAELVVDEAGSVLSISPSMAKLIGVDGASLLAWHELADRDDLAVVAAMVLPPFPTSEPRRRWCHLGVDQAVAGVLEVRSVRWPGVDQAGIVSFVPSDRCPDGVPGTEPSDSGAGLWLDLAFGRNVVGTALLGAQGRIVATNAALRELMGEIPAVFTTDAVHPDDVEEAVHALAQAWLGRSVTIDHRLLRSGESPLRVHTNVMPVVVDQRPHLLVQVVPTATAHRLGARDIDPLTGLLDRGGITAAVRDRLQERRETAEDFAVVSVDIDGFNAVNAAVGAVAADDLLVQVGARLRASLPSGAAVGRLVADRFAVVLPCASQHELASVASGLVTELRRIEPAGLGRSIDVRAGAVLVATDEQSVAHVKQIVEQITQAARLRPDRIMVRVLRDRSDGTFSIGESQAREWCRSVESALGGDSFAAVAEPLRPLGSASDGTLEHFELFVRLILPDGEWMSLPKFDRLAARLDRRTHIDRWMIRRAVRYLTRQPSLAVEVNLTRATVQDDTAVDWIAAQIADAGLDAGRLLVAVDERLVADDPTGVTRFTDRARSAGLGLCIDNFGAHGGGAHELSELAPRRVKLPGTVVSHSAAERSAAAALAELVSIARDAGVETAAVFVADADVYGAIQEIGVDLAQGWHIGRAVSLDVR